MSRVFNTHPRASRTLGSTPQMLGLVLLWLGSAAPLPSLATYRLGKFDRYSDSGEYWVCVVTKSDLLAIEAIDPNPTVQYS